MYTINSSFLLYLRVILADVLKTIYTSHEAVSIPVNLYNLYYKLVLKDFDSIFIFDILWIDQPENLRKYEQSFINRLKTLYPFGLNNINSITGKQ